MAINKSSSFTAAERTIIEKARFWAQHNAPMAGLVEKFTMPKGANTITVNRYEDLTADALTDGIDMATGKSLSLTSVSLTTSEYGLKVIVTDKMVRENVDNVFKNIGKQCGDAMSKYRDGKLLALFESLTENGTLVGAGSDLTVAKLAAGVSILQGVPVPSGRMVGVFHPYAFYDLWSDLINHGTDIAVPWVDMADSMIKQYFMGQDKRTLLPLFQDGHLSIDASDDAYGCIFVPEAFALCTEKDWYTEDERDASLRGTEVNMVADEGFTELVDKYAVQVISDCSTPS